MLAVMTIPSTAPPDSGPASDEANRLAALTAEWLTAVAEHQDRKAFEQLYGYFAPRLQTYLIRQGADAGSAAELTQETMVQVWRKAHQYDATRAVPGAWVYRIARNLRIDRLRKQRFHEVDINDTPEFADDGIDSSRRSMDRIDASRLPQLLDTLPTEQSEIVRLAYFEGLTHAEICQHINLPLGTVKSRMRLAFTKLRAAMGAQS